jgi:hypothetical protein
VAASRTRGARRGSTLPPLLPRLCGAEGELDALPRAVSPAVTTAELLSSSCGVLLPGAPPHLDLHSIMPAVSAPSRCAHCPLRPVDCLLRSRSPRTHASPLTLTLPIHTTPYPPTHPLLPSQRLKRRVRQRQQGSGPRGCGGGCVGARVRWWGPASCGCMCAVCAAAAQPLKLRRRSRGGRGGAAAQIAAAQPGRLLAAQPRKPRRRSRGGCWRLRRRSRGGCASIPWARRSVGAVSTAERWRVGASRELCGGGGRVGSGCWLRCWR